jgi:hypothetical protein
VKLPFSALNNQPGVSGLQDVDLPVGDILSIVQDIQDTVFSTDDLLDLLEGDAQQALEDATPIDEIAAAVTGSESTDISALLSDAVQKLSDEIIDARQVLQDELDETEESILDALAGELDDISVVVEGVDIDEDEIADEIADELDVPGDGGTVINFDSVFGAVASTIEESFQIALDGLFGDPGKLPDGIDTVFGALGALLESIGEIPDLGGEELIVAIRGAVVQELVSLPGGELLDAPDTFIDSQIDRVTDGLVDESAQQSLQQSIDEVS